MKLPGFQVSDRNLQIKVACQNIHLAINKYSLGVFCSQNLYILMRNMLSVPSCMRVTEFCSYMVKPGCNAKDFPGSPVEALLPMQGAPDSIPGWGIKILYAVQNHPKKTNIKSQIPKKKVGCNAIHINSILSTLFSSLHNTALYIPSVGCYKSYGHNISVF